MSLPNDDNDDAHDNSTCYNSMCALLPVGYVLLACDSYYDLQWCLWPSPKTREALIRYYTNILTPQPKYLWPGYYWPLYCIYKFCYACPDVYNILLLLLFVPIAYRYRGILDQSDQELGHWWTIVVLRLLLAWVTYLGRSSRGCQWSEWPANAQAFVWSNQNSNDIDGYGDDAAASANQFSAQMAAAALATTSEL